MERFDRFDFEREILNCWHVVDDIKHLNEMVMDRDASTDNITNVLLGLHVLYNDRFTQLHVLYNDRFTQLMDVSETLISGRQGSDIFFRKNHTESDERDRVDNIIRAGILDQYYSLKREIEELKDTNNLPKYEKEDLTYNEKLLDACVTILKHYTAHSELPEELK
jgi:hypothetical protein